MAKIQSKLNSDQYQTLDDFMADFHLMFDNACRYNEPDSQVYKVCVLIIHKTPLLPFKKIWAQKWNHSLYFQKNYSRRGFSQILANPIILSV